MTIVVKKVPKFLRASCGQIEDMAPLGRIMSKRYYALKSNCFWLDLRAFFILYPPIYLMSLTSAKTKKFSLRTSEDTKDR